MKHHAKRIKSLTTTQQYIYEGLQQFGEEVSAFYLDALKIKSDNSLLTRSNLLAHLAREIDGGLRDILSIKENSPVNNEVKTTQRDSIAMALNTSVESTLAKDWHNSAKRFARFAHRHGAYKDPRDLSQFEPIWNEYEKILARLVGNAYAVQSRVQRLAQYETPTKEMLATLPNLFTNPVLYNRFFDELKQPGWLEPLYKAGYFSPSTVTPDQVVTLPTGENVIQSSNWAPAEYLKVVAETNQIGPSKEVTAFLTAIIEGYIDYHTADNTHIQSYRTNYRIIELIGRLPAATFSEKHFAYLQWCLETGNVYNLVTQTIIQQWLPNLLGGKNQKMLMRLLELLMMSKLVNQPDDDLLSESVETSLVDDYWLYSHLPAYISEIGIVIGEAGFQIIYQRVKQILASQPKLLLYLTWSGSLNWREDPYYNREVSVFPVFLCANVLPHISGDTTALLTELLTDPCDQYVAKRIALYGIASRYDQTADAFWQLPYNPFNIHQLDVELASLVQLHHTIFTDRQVDQIIDWLDTCDSSLNANPELTSEQVNQYHIRKIHRFYSLMRDTTHPKLLQKIALFDQLTGSSTAADSQDFEPVHIESGFWEPEPPLEADTLSALTTSELAAYLTDYHEVDGFGFSKVEDLRREFTQLLMGQPHQYYSQLSYFSRLPSAYISVVYETATELQKKGKFGYWQELLTFAEDRIHQPDFWQSSALHHQHQFWGGVIPETTALHRLISAGLEVNKEFNVALVPLAKTTILRTVSTLRDLESVPTSHHPFDRLLNSGFGTGITALLNLNLYYARQLSPATRQWDKDIQEFFEQELETDARPELYELLGTGLSRFNFIDTFWVKRNIDRIFNKTQPDNWLLAFSAYVQRYEPDNYFYDLLKGSGNYAYSLTHSLLSRDYRRMTVRHIMRYYIRRVDKLDAPNSLLGLVLKNRDFDWLTQVVHYFRNDGDRYGITPLKENQLRFLWRRIHKLIKRNSQKIGFNELASSLSHWVGYLSELDAEAQQWLNLIVANCQQQDIRPLLDHLYKFVNPSPLIVTAIVLKMAQRKTDFDSYYSFEKLPAIVDVLYEKRYQQQADSICNEFGRRGSNLLADVYLKYNPL